MIAEFPVPGKVGLQYLAGIGIGLSCGLTVLTERLLGVAIQGGVGIIVHACIVVGKVFIQVLSHQGGEIGIGEAQVIGKAERQFDLGGEVAHEVIVFGIQLT